MASVRVLVVDDSPVFQAALRQVLDSSAELEQVGEAECGEDGVALARRLAPDLVVVDVMLPGIDGIETCRRLEELDPAPFVVLCSVDDDPRGAAGASGARSCATAPFVTKASLSASALLEAWRARGA
jgi:DNA-binding NarL/FixJ family response regulator